MSAQGDNWIVAEDQDAQLERAFIVEYLRERGQTFDGVHRLTAQEEKRMLTGACLYAAMKLEEMHDKAHMAHELHNVTEGCGNHSGHNGHRPRE